MSKERDLAESPTTTAEGQQICSRSGSGSGSGSTSVFTLQLQGKLHHKQTGAGKVWCTRGWGKNS
jgi:hypothetical protein